MADAMKGKGWCDHMNPANVPMPRLERESWAALENASAKQADLLVLLAEQTSTSPPELFGAGFVHMTRLSRWAASWGIDTLRIRVQEIEVKDAATKRAFLDYYAARNRK